MALTKEDLQAIGALLEAERENTSQMMDGKLEQSEKRTANQFRAVIETDVIHKINLLAEGHGDIVNKLKELDTLNENVEDIQDTVDVLKHIVVKK